MKKLDRAKLLRRIRYIKKRVAKEQDRDLKLMYLGSLNEARKIYVQVYGSNDWEKKP
jgi:hypothetical protein